MLVLSGTLLVLSSLALAADPLPCGTVPAGMACIPGGTFTRGVDPSRSLCESFDGWECATKNAIPTALVSVATFYMDLTEVTYEAYKSCEAAGRCDHAGPNYGDFNRPKQPITGVSWFNAVKYCTAQGKHLPTEAEWEKAARGPDGALNPWGDEIATCERAVIMDASGRSCGVKKATQPEKGRPLEVGSRPAGVYGLVDMIGNVQEWVYDWYAPSYSQCGEACSGPDPRGPCGGSDPCPGFDQRVVKGGSWYWDARHANGADRRSHYPKNDPIFHHFGFRCAASVEEAAHLP